jgi:hypothetical protein
MFRRDLLDSEQDDLAAAGRRAAGALREALRATGGNAGAAGGDDVCMPTQVERQFRRKLNAIPTMLNAVSDAR